MKKGSNAEKESLENNKDGVSINKVYKRIKKLGALTRHCDFRSPQ